MRWPALRLRRTGLRVRVIAGFAAGALGLSATMAFVSYEITRRSLLAERERTGVRAAYYDAAVVRAGIIATARPDIAAVLRSLDTGENRRALLFRDGQWYARNADTGFTRAVPAALRQRAEAGQPAVQRVRAGGVPTLVVAVPILGDAVFYEVDSFQELDHTLGVLTIVLTLVAMSVAAAGAGLGWYASRYVLRPLPGFPRPRVVHGARTRSALPDHDRLLLGHVLLAADCLAALVGFRVAIAHRGRTLGVRQVVPLLVRAEELRQRRRQRVLDTETTHAFLDEEQPRAVEGLVLLRGELVGVQRQRECLDVRDLEGGIDRRLRFRLGLVRLGATTGGGNGECHYGERRGEPDSPA
ncbi:two-component sensor histidine kinase [Micromonosporaceae bacterium Da 78-11]